MTPNKEPEVVAMEAGNLGIAMSNLCGGKSLQVVFSAISAVIAVAVGVLPEGERRRALGKIMLAASACLNMEEDGDADGSPHRKTH